MYVTLHALNVYDGIPDQNRSSHRRCSAKKMLGKHFLGKHLYWSLFLKVKLY